MTSTGDGDDYRRAHDGVHTGSYSRGRSPARGMDDTGRFTSDMADAAERRSRRIVRALGRSRRNPAVSRRCDRASSPARRAVLRRVGKRFRRDRRNRTSCNGWLDCVYPGKLLAWLPKPRTRADPTVLRVPERVVHRCRLRVPTRNPHPVLGLVANS